MDEVYFVHWYEDDDNGGLEEFKSLDEVYKRIVELTTKCALGYTSVSDMKDITVIKGVKIDHHDNPYLLTIPGTVSPDSRESEVCQIARADS